MTTTHDLIRLTADLWPRWTITQGIADLMLRKFSELDPDHVEQAIREHRLTRSTVPDLGEIVKSAKAMQDAREEMARHALRQQAMRASPGELEYARRRIQGMETELRLWVWRYCREMARHRATWEEEKGWPDHWCEVPPPTDAWPEQVVEAYHEMHQTLGV